MYEGPATCAAAQLNATPCMITCRQEHLTLQPQDVSHGWGASEFGRRQVRGTGRGAASGGSGAWAPPCSAHTWRIFACSPASKSQLQLVHATCDQDASYAQVARALMWRLHCIRLAEAHGRTGRAPSWQWQRRPHRQRQQATPCSERGVHGCCRSTHRPEWYAPEARPRCTRLHSWMSSCCTCMPAVPLYEVRQRVFFVLNVPLRHLHALLHDSGALAGIGGARHMHASSEVARAGAVANLTPSVPTPIECWWPMPAAKTLSTDHFSPTYTWPHG